MRERILKAYARWVTRYPKAIVLGAFLVSAIALTFSILFLKTQTGILDLYSEKEPVAQRFIEYINKFGAAETLIIVVEGPEESERQAAMEAIASSLKQDPEGYISDILYKIDLELFKKHAFQFLQEKQARHLLQETRRPDGGIRIFFEARDLNDYFNYLNQKIAQGLKSPDSQNLLESDGETSVQAFAQGLAPLFLLQEFLDGADLKPEAMTSRLGIDPKQKTTIDDLGYLRTDDGKMHIMLITPSDRKQDYRIAKKMVEEVRSKIQPIKKAFPGVTIGVTGGPALNKDQFEISERDMTKASTFAFISTGIIFILAFRSFGRPALGLLTLALSITWCFGFTTLTIGHLNMFSLAFIVILVGQGTYYGVHVVSRYEEELIQGHTVPEAIQNTIVHIFGNITTSTITTSAAFYATMLVPLQGFAELGFIAGSGILLSSLGMQMVLPAFLLLYDAKGPRGKLHGSRLRGRLQKRWKKREGDSSEDHPINQSKGLKERWLGLAKNLVTQQAPYVIGVVLIVALWGGYRFFSAEYAIPFDSNLLNLQAKGTEAVTYEKKLIETSLSPRAGIYLTSNLQEAQRIVAAAQKLPTVQRVEWLGGVLPEGTIRSQTHQRLRTALQRLPQGKLRPPNLKLLEKNLKKLESNLEKISELALNYTQGAEILEVTEAAIEAIQDIKEKLNVTEELAQDSNASEDLPSAEEDALETLHREKSPKSLTQQVLQEQFLLPQLEEFQNRFFPALRQMFERAATAERLEIQDVPNEIVSRFLSQDGTYAIYAYPSVNIWEQEPLTNFVHDLQSVSPTVTGPPIMFSEILKLVRTSYFHAAAFSALAILIVFFLDFKSLRYTLLAFLPLILGIFSLFGLMSLLKLSFNTANMIALPMILGIGADNGVHMIHRFREEKEKTINFLFGSTGKALLITYLDTLTSFVGLAVANHQGLAQLGRVVILGITCCTAAGILVLPSIMSLIIRGRGGNLVKKAVR